MSAADLESTRRLLAGRYEILQELGRGGMGAVYLARDLRLDRPVALKVLPESLTADPGLRERFLRETRTAASFSHPNIVPVHAVEDHDGVLAYAMGFVEGESLAQRVARAGPLGIREIVRLLQDIGYALAYAHGRGVVHRDIKPDNIMLERATGRALLMDFGISRTITAQVDRPGLTRVGEVVGTPEYMSPEQASGDVVDGRSDLYALGLVAFFAAAGRPAVTGETTQKILIKQLTEPVPPVGDARTDLPAPLAAAIDRCAAKEPGERFPTAEALIEAIDQSQLATAEIPLQVRMFAQELGTLSLVLLFLTVISMLVLRNLLKTASTVDAFLPVVLLSAVGFTRLLQSLAAGRRLAMTGFSETDILKGMRAVVDEHQGVRAALSHEPDTRRQRRRTLKLGLGLIAGSIGLTWWSIALRIQVGPQQFRMPWHGIAMVFASFACLGVGLILTIRSPFRMPPGERLFRLVWLGPVGRAFVRLAGRRTPRTARVSPDVTAHLPVRAVAQAPPPNAGSTLERRVAALEAWRDGIGPDRSP